MSKFKCWFIMLIVLSAVSCKDFKEELVIIEKFPEEKFIRGERIEIGPYYDYNPIFIIDTFLLVGAERGEKKLFHAYSTNTGGFISEIISKGRGPCEVIITAIIPQTDLYASGLLHIYDISQWNITEFNLSQLILHPGYTCKRDLIEIPLSQGPISNIKYISGELIIYENGRSRFSIYNKTTREIESIPFQLESPSFKLKKGNEERLYYSGGLCVNTVLRRIVSAPYSVGKLDFYEVSGEHRSTVVFSDYGDLNKSIKDFNSEIKPSMASLNLYTFNLFSDYDYIYLVTTDPILKRGELVEHDTDFGNIRSQLLIFDWDGNAIRKIVFDRFLIQTGIDLKTMTVYGLAPSPSEGLVMYKYSLEQ